MDRLSQRIKDLIRGPAESLVGAYLSSRTSLAFDPARIERILVFAYHGLGNFIMYTPALKALRDAYPKVRIDLQVGNKTGCEEVLAGAGLFDNVYDLPYSAGLKAWVKRIVEVRKTAYDLTINEFHSHSWQLALLVAFGKSPFRVGHVTSPGWPRRFSRYSFVFNMPVQMREDQHEVERYLDLVAAAGARSGGLPEAKPFVHLANEDTEFARLFIEERSGSRSGPVIGVQPGTSPGMRWKQWPVERYRVLLEYLAVSRPESLVVLFGSAGEAAMIEELAEGLGPGVAVAAGKTTVKQVAALIERCELMLCNDSGLMHVAAAVGTPVVAIYGPTDFRRTAPVGPGHTMIRHELPCSPCFKLEGDDQVHLCPHHDCLMTIRPREVIEAVDRSLENVQVPAGTGRRTGGGAR